MFQLKIQLTYILHNFWIKKYFCKTIEFSKKFATNSIII